MDRNQKIAFARIISDLIEADFIVEKREMDYFESVISREQLRISRSMLVECKHLTLSKAVKDLRDLPEKEKTEVIALIKELALADGNCVPQEAILMLALIESLEGNGDFFSVKAGDLHLENLTAIYIENEQGTATDGYVDNHFREINNELAMAGFQFVYIPHIAKDFDTMDKDYLKKVVNYMIPSASEERTCQICDDLCNITTVRFCRDLLYKKIGLNLIGAPPSLLFKVNDSAIVTSPDGMEESERVAYSNFLLLDMGDDMLLTIRKMVDAYGSMVSCMKPVQIQPGHKKFLYNGFHRWLFDLICYGREMKEYHLVINLENRDVPVVFQSDDGEELPVKMGAQEAALYILIVQESLRGKGLDWREHIPKEEKKELMEKYNAIYRQIGKGRVATDYKDRTLAHHIRTKVKALQQIANRDMFVPENVKEGKESYYRVVAPESHVVIRI